MRESQISIDKKLEFLEIVKKELLLDKSGYVNIVNVSQKTTLTDFFVVAIANSSIHINLLVNTIKKKMKDFSFSPVRKDGNMGNSSWVIIDYGFVIFHIMTEDMKNFYKMEEFWEKELKIEETID